MILVFLTLSYLLYRLPGCAAAPARRGAAETHQTCCRCVSLKKVGYFKPKPSIRSKPKCASQINPNAVSCGAGNSKEISKSATGPQYV